MSRTGTVLLTLCLAALRAHAVTLTATSTSFTDVLTATSAANDGDTVRLPAGSSVWTAPLTLGKAITLLGAGTNRTVLYAAGDTLLSLAPLFDKPVRISGISFNNQAGAQKPSLVLNGKLTSFRVDHCSFNFGKRAISPIGWCYGVIDHCSFLNCDIGIGVTGDDDFAWNRPLQPGSTNCVCIEDNTFTIDNNTPYEPNEQVYHQEGTRTIIRRNTFDGSAYTQGNSLFLDAHGNQGYFCNCGADFRGTVLLECYSNTFHAYNTYRFSYFRGGTLFVFANTMTCDTGSTVPLAVDEEEGWQIEFFQPLRIAWPAQDQITNAYFWANTLNGAPITSLVLWKPTDSIFIREGRDYWMHAPNSTNVYYPYTPLVYPHPLVAAQDSPGPGVPAIGVTPASRDFGSVKVGSTNALMFVVRNLGGGKLSGIVTVPPPFGVVGASAYALAGDATQLVTIRYLPSQPGKDLQPVTFTGGGGATVAVSGSATP